MRGWAAWALGVSIFLGACDGKKIDQATRTCESSYIVYTDGRILDNCEVCCSSALTTQHVDKGTGKVKDGHCVCSVE